MLLRLDEKRIVSKIPAVMTRQLIAYANGNVVDMTTTWEDSCKSLESELKALPLETMSGNSLCWDGHQIRSVSVFDMTKNRGFSDLYPMYVMRPRSSKVAAIFCREFFAFTNEGARSFKRVFSGWKSLSQLQENLKNTEVHVPRFKVAQIRWAIELRAAREALKERYMRVLRTPLPFSRCLGMYRARLRTSRLGS